MSYAWPSFGPQYEEFLRLGLVKDATYYVLFYLCLIIFLAYFTQKIVRWSFANSDRLKPNYFIPVILMLAPFTYWAMVWDAVDARPSPPYEFFIDSFGLYYIRQFVLFIGTANMFVLFFVLFFVGGTTKAIKKIYTKIFGAKYTS